MNRSASHVGNPWASAWGDPQNSGALLKLWLVIPKTNSRCHPLVRPTNPFGRRNESFTRRPLPATNRSEPGTDLRRSFEERPIPPELSDQDLRVESKSAAPSIARGLSVKSPI